MLGGLRVVQSDRTITRFQTQKTGALLGYIALHRTSSHSREVLAELLWPGGDPVAVRNRLNQAVSSLRRQLEPASVVYGSVLLTDQRSIRLQPDAVVTDVEEFERLILKAESVEAKTEQCALLKKAVDLYGGEFLAGYYADWVGMEQLRISDLYTNALYDLLDVARGIGDSEVAIRAANLLLKADPADEGTHCDLMRLYIDAGRPSAAKRQYEELARILATEEATPSDEAFQLHQEASSRRSTNASMMEPPAVSETKEEPITVEEIPTNLPSPTNRFVGRESEIEKLTTLLSTDSTHLVTIVGLGGCGKTRLALQTALGLLPSFAGNVFYISFTDTQDWHQIEELIASAIGVRGPENIHRKLSRNEKTLLVLDSFEHLADLGANYLQTLLESVANLKILVTSRQPLRIDAERIFTLSALPTPGASDHPDELIQNPCVALLVDRAQAVLPDFQITQRNADVIRQICTRLEGIPLAIELVASWAKTVAPSQMVAMLSDRFALLESRRRDISTRHRTMRAVIDSSVDLLDPELRSIFHRLSVFQGGWSLEAAAEVCQIPNVLSAMSSLSEHSLIQSENTDGEWMRFRMLDTLRDYASEHLPAAAQAECSNLHASFYSQLAQTSEEQIVGNEQRYWCDRLESEYANLTAAFQWYLGHHLIDSALSLANSLAFFWEFQGRASEGKHWLKLALQRLDAVEPLEPQIYATALNNLARLTWIHGDFAEAAFMHATALEACQKIDDTRGIITAQFNIQMEAHRTRNYSNSIALLKDNLARAEQIDDKYLQARAWLSLGNTLVELREFGEAKVTYEKSLKTARELNNKYRIATSLNNLGNLATLEDQFDLAKHYLLEAVALFEEIGVRPSLTDAYLHLAKMERKRQDIPAALKWQERVWKNAPEETYHIQALFLEQAFAASAVQNSTLAVTFLGFVEQLREDLGALNFDVEAKDYDDLVNRSKQALTPQAFETAWQMGRNFDLPQAARKMLRP